MGTSQTKEVIVVESAYDKFCKTYNLEVITKNDMYVILKQINNYMIKIVIEEIIIHDNLTEIGFNKLLNIFHFKSSGELLKQLFINIYNEFDSELMKKLICSFTLFQNEEVVSCLLNAITKSDLNNQLTLDYACSWLDKNAADIGCDLCSYITKVLNCKISPNVSILNLKNDAMSYNSGTILNEITLELLLGSLPVSYKTCFHEITISHELLKYWILLYNSDIHGLSTSKLREMSFDFTAPILLLVKTENSLFCLACETGLREDFKIYGGCDTRFVQLSPKFHRIISGSVDKTRGIIYSNMTCKTGKRGIFIGHNPLGSPAAEIDEDLSKITVISQSHKIYSIEVWAIGSSAQGGYDKLKDIRKWEQGLVEKHKNRKLKMDDWQDSPDRILLDMAGVNTRNTDLIGGTDHKPKDGDKIEDF